jgi:uncharacterized protein YbjQ (UPF0145 family)
MDSRQNQQMIITTTQTIEGQTITRYLGIVSGEAILGANVFKDLFAGLRDIVGGRSAAYEEELRRAKTIALQEMEEYAQSLGANAVVGVDLDYENLGASGGMLMVSASGTAVLVGYCDAAAIRRARRRLAARPASVFPCTVAHLKHSRSKMCRAYDPASARIVRARRS